MPAAAARGLFYCGIRARPGGMGKLVCPCDMTLASVPHGQAALAHATPQCVFADLPKKRRSSLDRPSTHYPRPMRLPDGRVRHRRRSINLPGHAHELTFSCFRGIPLLNSDRTRQWFIDALQRARQNHHFDLWAYVIMPEHAHVLVNPFDPDYEMATILKGIKQSVSRRAMLFLRAHAPESLARFAVTRYDGRIEHRFWQRGGGYDRNIVELDTVLAVIEYIHNNPVRGGLVSCHLIVWIAWSHEHVSVLRHDHVGPEVKVMLSTGS